MPTRWFLLLAYALHLLILALFVLDVIPQEFHRAGYPFWFHHGGDDYGYVSLAQDLVSGDFRPNKYPLGFPLLLVPFLWIFPQEHDALLQPVALFWALAMFPLAQRALFRLARRLLCSPGLALLAVLLWTGLPLLTYLALRVISSPVAAETSAVHLTWAQMLSDGPATFFTLLIFEGYFVIRERRYPLWMGALLGLLCGFLMLIRLTGVLSLGVVFALLLVERRWRSAFIVGLFALLAFSPQMLYNARFFGGPLVSGYTVLDQLPPLGLFHPAYFQSALALAWGRMGLLLPLAIVVSGVLFILGLLYLWRRSRTAALLAALWIGGYVGLYSVYYYSWEHGGGILRFWMPAYPGMAILAAALIGWLLAVSKAAQSCPLRRWNHDS